MNKFETGLYTLLLIVLLPLVSLGIYATYKTTFASGETEYCYIEFVSPEGMPPFVRLHSFRPWRMDRIIGIYKSVDDASADANKLGCKVGKK